MKAKMGISTCFPFHIESSEKVALRRASRQKAENKKGMRNIL
jgi:hypothetical protein